MFFIRYHTGSLAFGAAIIAIVQFIRAVLEYIDRKVKGTFDYRTTSFITLWLSSHSFVRPHSLAKMVCFDIF